MPKKSYLSLPMIGKVFSGEVWVVKRYLCPDVKVTYVDGFSDRDSLHQRLAAHETGKNFV